MVTVAKRTREIISCKRVCLSGVTWRKPHSLVLEKGQLIGDKGRVPWAFVVGPYKGLL